jgi:glycine cleavage system aminomethyltransferase T/glycine/D-amino acid oxidase-like deaminating enzyme
MSSNTLPDSAGTVIIGAGIVGNSLAYHLADQGREDILLVDKGPLPDPGGSTGHASNFLMPVEHSKEMTELTADSIEQFKEAGVFTKAGGLEVARTDEQMEENKRRVQSAKAYGANARLIDAEEVKELVPYINDDIIKGAMYAPDAGVCDSLQFGEICRQRAKDMGALTVSPNTEVTDIVTEGETVTDIETDRGEVTVEDELVIAAGIWSPKLAEMAGTRIPLTPAVHQMITVGPIEQFEERGVEGIEDPIVRDMDHRMYERQHGSEMEVGSYSHRPILWDVEDIPSIDEAPLSPTQPPLTDDAFEESMQHALEIMPEILDDPDAGIRHSIDGLLSLTADGGPVVGPVPELDNLWSVAAIWIKEAPAIAKNVAKWMEHGYGAIDTDLEGINIARYEEYGRAERYIEERSKEGFRKIYGTIHPSEQWQTGRPLRQTGFHDRLEEHDAEFWESAGWERPRWFRENADLLQTYQTEISEFARPNEWDRRWWSPIILAEHLHMRDNVGLIGDMGFGIYEIQGPDALDLAQKLTVGRMDVDVGKLVYTPVLDEDAGFRADLTVVRLGENRFRFITGGGDAGHDKQWVRQQMEPDMDVELVSKSSALGTMGVWGPNARKVMQEITEEDMSDDAFPAYTAQQVHIGDVEALAMRISYVGELGWEIYAPMEQTGRLWDTIYEAGQEYDLRPVGTGVYGSTGRMEKGYRLLGAELEHDYNPVEAGLDFHGVKDADFVGKDAYVEAVESEPAAKLCTLSVTDHNPEGGEERYPLGGEPVKDLDGNVLVDEEGRRSYTTSAATGPSVGKHILLAYIPTDVAEEGKELQVEYFGQDYPVEIEVVGGRPLFDPGNERILS